ncbi:MAG TPA: LysR family transcriptional regulator, partial [Telluria sp.]|nr:LysR family transcriptional regulator [Telluria sp.]
MDRDKLADLAAFAIIAEERSFRKAAARLGISGSALSHAMRVLEDRLGVKLLHRTTRNIAPTEAGERLLAGLKPALVDIDHALQGLDSYRGRPAGRVRISAHRSAAIHLIAPKLRGLRDAYPEVIVELSIDDGLIDIVSAGFDAGVRRGEQLEKDMISVRVGADSQMAVVASPDYFMNAPYPTSPSGLSQHSCIGYRYIASRELHRWRFEKDGRTLHVAVEPGFITNDADMLVQA